MYEDRLRNHWHKQCEAGRTINLEEEAGKVNKEVMDDCRTRIDGVLKATGLSPNGAPQAALHSKEDDQATAAVRLQANQAVESMRFKAAEDSLKQKQASLDHKMQALKDSQHQQNSKKRTFFNAGNCRNSKG